MTFRVSAGVPVVQIDADLIGDGLDAQTVIEGADLRPVRSVWLTPALRGRYWIQVRVLDACGRMDATGIERWVEVK